MKQFQRHGPDLFRLPSSAPSRIPAALLLAGLLAFGNALSARGEVILQYFNTSWRELTDKLPELAEVGYDALWLPPPTKGSGGLSVGYDCWDPFDLGSKDQRGSVRTRYGTEAELLRLIETAHRFGLRVYVDNIMNHRAFDVPGYDAYTPVKLYPGMVPEDFHLRLTAEGFYRKWDNVANWSDSWQIQYRNFSDLIDIAQETPDNGNFGRTEGEHVPKIKLVRHPDNPEYYCYKPGPSGAEYVGFGLSNTLTRAMLADPANAWLYEEDVGAYLVRAARWLVDRTHIDGLRLDAVKHVPDYFFGQQSGADKDASSAGYCGQAQQQFNLTRGFSDSSHRDTVFNTETEQGHGRDDLMMFGEHLGEPPGVGGYIDAGMRLVDSRLHGYLNGNLGSPWGALQELDKAGGRGFSAETGVAYIKSHDDDYASRPELQHALILLREGLPCVYTDGNHQAETLGESGGAFPRHANTAFLGQFGDPRIPNLVYLHNHFARGPQRYDNNGAASEGQIPRWADADVVAFERRDKRENRGMSDTDGTVLFFIMNDNYAAGMYREVATAFPPGARLWQYAAGAAGFFYTVPSDQKIKVITPPGGYFAFSWRSPEDADAWARAGGRPVTLYANGRPCPTLTCTRADGPDGDPAFNPHGVTDPNATDFAYTMTVPHVTTATNLRFVARVDGSAASVLMRLDGGVDLNGLRHAGGDPRDNPPALANDIFLGYETTRFVQRSHREKFAARNTERHNVIGSPGAETYSAVIGQAGFTISTGVEGRDSDTETARWLFHDPAQSNHAGASQFSPAPAAAAGQPITVWAKMGYQNDVNALYLYYTTDGATYPEGAGGEGVGATRAVAMAFRANITEAGGLVTDWWSGEIPAADVPDGATLRYKIGAFRRQNGSASAPWRVPFPNDDDSLANKRSLLGVWEVTNFNAAAVSCRLHNDYGASTTGLTEGFHVLRARAFLERDNRASIYNTFVQPFYYDTALPAGEVLYPRGAPQEPELLSQGEYTVVVRTDPTVRQVSFNIDDDTPANDDGQTGQAYGNGTNAAGSRAWAPASEVTPSSTLASPYPGEWRFTYRNIPSGGGAATLRVRLLELSSSTNMVLADAAGHFTTLQRQVRTGAPTQRLFFQWPAQDGAEVREGWSIRVSFSRGLADGLDDQALRERFLVRVDGNALGLERYAITRDADGTYGLLAFSMPNVYNGDPNLLHDLEVTHTTGTGLVLEAHRFVKAAPADTGPHIDIVNPPEYDSDGKPYVIVLPDVPTPTPGQRQFTIRVETDLSARHVWLVFPEGNGNATPYATLSNRLPALASAAAGTNRILGVAQPLTGTLTVTQNTARVMGTGTAFLAELSGGMHVGLAGQTVVVTQVESDVSAALAAPYPGATAAGVAGAVLPAFDTALTAGDIVRVNGALLRVAEVESPAAVRTDTAFPGPTAVSQTVYRISGNPSASGNRLYWHFLWSDLREGTYRIVANVNTNASDTATVSASAVRNTRVVFREVATNDVADLDDDDDGLYDVDESTPKDLPAGNSEEWRSGDVHVWQIYGRTDPLLPDSDGDGLPDGLESGWRVPIATNHTDVAADSNGDGYPNFLPDLDPPFYNTVPDSSGLPHYVFSDSRTRRINGSLTDPQNPDTDRDGLPDGLEDRNRNGWVDGDGRPLQPRTSNPWSDRPTLADWPDGIWDAAWRETDPNDADTDGDGASDGYAEDVDLDGVIDGDTNSNRVHDVGELWLETDPLNPDTDGDTLPDGWEARYALDPLNDGITNHVSLRTGLAITNAEHGAAGNPDGDRILVGGELREYTNKMEYQNGTNPRVPDSLDPPPPGSITVGRGRLLGITGGRTNYEEFTDWRAADCLVLDEYEGAGNNNQSGDLYLAWDGWDTSRDIVAFYAHDGGDPANGGDGKFYFRLDFHDLLAHAEEGHLDAYVVIDFNSPDAGEMNLPDDVDAITHMRWEAVVAVYQTGAGAVYVDDPANPAHTSAVGQDLAATGVRRRGQAAADGFVDAYFNHELDAVEFCISRQALIDAGWSGSGASNFNYQVFTTADGTSNSPVGPGDIGGRNDIRDSILDDWIAEDYWQSQQGLRNELFSWWKGTARAGRAKVAALLHGNQAIQPGCVVQDLVNTGRGAGLYRPLDAHAVFAAPLNLHVSATLASAMQWARVDPAAGQPWRDGPSLNRRIAALVATNLVYLLPGTFSDHMLPYFSRAFNRANADLARRYIETIYRTRLDPATAVFWTPERLLDGQDLGDGSVFDKVRDLGYTHTVLDQDTHLFNWFGREDSLSDNGYRINRIDGVKCFAIHNTPSAAMFTPVDNGVDTTLRQILNRKARSGTQDQVLVLFAGWEALTDNARADAYDTLVRWCANRPWTPLVALQQIAAGAVHARGDPAGDAWGVVERDAPALGKQAHNWLNHASMGPGDNGNFDNWYVGNTREESLAGRRFALRSGGPLTAPYGMLYSGGLVREAWDAVNGITHSNLAALAQAALHASVFQTAFHNEGSQDLRRFSTGAYMFPATSSNSLASFALIAQAQTRTAAVYAQADAWAAAAASLTGTVARAADADLDGEDEYLLYNRRLCVVLERLGGRLIAAWVRVPRTAAIYQVIGNPAGFAGSATEEEGSANVSTQGQTVTVGAYRTSALKDWWDGSRSYVNDLYVVTPWSNGWRAVSSDGRIAKTVQLPADSAVLEVRYTVPGSLYVRHGLSPHLDDLLVNGQSTLAPERQEGGVLTVANTNYTTTVNARVAYGDAGHGAVYNALATDEDTNRVDYTTLRMRNQAQTHQVELRGTGTFSFALAFDAAPSDWDGDGMPNSYEDAFGLETNALGGAEQDADHDGMVNRDEYLAGTSPLDPSDALAVTDLRRQAAGWRVRFSTRAQRDYTIWYRNQPLPGDAWNRAGTNRIPGTGGTVEWLDDGSRTTPHPFAATNRFYRIGAQMAE